MLKKSDYSEIFSRILQIPYHISLSIPHIAATQSRVLHTRKLDDFYSAYVNWRCFIDRVRRNATLVVNLNVVDVDTAAGCAGYEYAEANAGILVYGYALDS